MPRELVADQGRGPAARSSAIAGADSAGLSETALRLRASMFAAAFDDWALLSRKSNSKNPASLVFISASLRLNESGPGPDTSGYPVAGYLAERTLAPLNLA